MSVMRGLLVRVPVILSVLVLSRLCTCLQQARDGTDTALDALKQCDSGLTDQFEEVLQPQDDDGDDQFGPSRGYFPAGCRWREVLASNSSAPALQYWDFDQLKWTAEVPSSCMLQTQEVPEGYAWKKTRNDPVLGQVTTPATSVEPHQSHTIMKNLWYNNGKWYALVEGDNFVGNIKMSRNQEITCLHVKNATLWLENTKHRIVPGDTLIFDFIFFLHPTAIGHWCEMMFPLFSILRRSTFKSPADNFVLLHLKRSHLMEWVRAVMGTTLGLGPRDPLPPIILQEETDNTFAQLTQPLEGVPADTWVSFESAMVVRDLFTGGKRSFESSSDAKIFRHLIYHNHGLVPPPLATKNQETLPPRTITFQRKRANRRIINEEPFLDLLRTYAPVNVVEFNSSHSFEQQIETMSKTGLFVSVHTSNLANAPFLPPGSAVLELIQRFWNWHGLDRSFAEQTQTLGDIHHFAWRAYHLNQTKYLSPRDEFRFGNWTDTQCKTEECVEAHTNVDIIVDLDQLKKLLDARLPLVFAGASVKDTFTLWPPNTPNQLQPWEVAPGRAAVAAATAKPQGTA